MERSKPRFEPGGGGSPLGEAKTVFFIPMAFASAFIIATNPSTDPPTRSAMSIAMSFALLSMSAFIASDTDIVSPGARSILDGSTDAARRDCAMLSFGLTRPSRTALRRSLAVISFVQEAG